MRLFSLNPNSFTLFLFNPNVFRLNTFGKMCYIMTIDVFGLFDCSKRLAFRH